MRWTGCSRAQASHGAVPVFGLALALLVCAPLADLALAWEAHPCQGAGEFPAVCAKAIGFTDHFPGLVPEPRSSGLAALVPDCLIPVAAWRPGPLRPTPAWSVRAPPSIA